MEVLKRVDLPPYKVPTRFREVTIRIGSEDVGSHPLSLITQNEKCGEFGEGTMEMVAIIFCGATMTGRYMTIQSAARVFFEFDEVEVFRL